MHSMVYKFSLPSTGEKLLSMPKGAVVLSVQNQREKLTLLALVNPDVLPEQRRFAVVMTGELFDARGMTFVGTVQLDDSAFVVHVFEVEG